MKAIERIKTVAARLGWQVNTENKARLVEFCFQHYTPAGQDFNFCVEMKKSNPDSLLDEIEKYYEDFDVDYEAYLWIGQDGHGKNSAPYHIKDIVTDMEQAETMIKTLHETLKAALR